MRCFVLIAALLASCGPPAPHPTGQTVMAETTAPAPASARYVGRWAANEGLCANGAWDFRADGVSTAGEVSCNFDQVTEVPGGYDIAATCTAEAPPEETAIRLRFAQSAGAMLVEGGPWSPIGLIPCEVSR